MPFYWRINQLNVESRILIGMNIIPIKFNREFIKWMKLIKLRIIMHVDIICANHRMCRCPWEEFFFWRFQSKLNAFHVQKHRYYGKHGGDLRGILGQMPDKPPEGLQCMNSGRMLDISMSSAHFPINFVAAIIIYFRSPMRTQAQLNYPRRLNTVKS